ncbi:GTP cyclohydrolase II [Alkanindiges hydrocarboniclasticus]|uniref:GTP cyclohydrolase-2 n=1 Tax=Alkanindiges hydrocarboniclasticus TaxID=1907941 RepID=A0A1S8CZH3_9GAMM|nr:GTP cyclohydrolase II [Alkanindiges hydrocarboniclasticus]ONG42212.1 GTP cyclohydrolase II [Alkanindiges hydrocarboniclasticus]
MPIQFVATSKLPTAHGEFDISVFEDPATGEEHVALSKGLLHNQIGVQADAVLVRLHSECLTGDAFASLRCDCGPQLNATLKMIEETGKGALLYLRQEGRGIGLPNKIRAYALQDQGHDTVDANLLLNLPADARTYEMCKVMLDHLGIRKVKLVTNNPAKVEALQQLGVNVVERVPLQVGKNPFNEGYLATKQQRMRHLF